MKKGLGVLAGRLEVLNEAKKRGAVKAGKPGFDAAPANSCFLFSDHLPMPGARYPGGVRVHHPEVSPKVNGERLWIPFKA